MFILFLISLCHTLECPSLYDFSTGSVRCVSVCQINTIRLGNNCCSMNQYLLNNRCYLCLGWVVNNGQNCCNYNEYWNKDARLCQKCDDEIFLNGTLCCKGCTYADMTVPTPVCRPVGQGYCSNLKCTSKQRLCCPGGQIFNAFQNKCVSNNSINYDSSLLVGCPLNYYLDYVHQTLTCVSKCSYGVMIDSLQCASKYCSSSNIQILNFESLENTLLALTNKRCCYSINNGICVYNNASCAKRYQYNLFPVCCPEGQNYDIRYNNCSFACNESIIMGFFCLSANSFIDFTATPPLISSHSLSLCNGKPLPTSINICCPVGYYSDGLKGCQPCRGNIFGTTNYQVCCLKNQFFNESSKQCLNCKGVIDRSGTICCVEGSYVVYNINGTTSCSQQCPLQSIQNTAYCCLFCQASCKVSFASCSTPKFCSSSYFLPDSCSPCSCGTCTTNPNCISCESSISALSLCNYQACEGGKVLEVGVCLDCDQSCQQCNAALDSKNCTLCHQGYYNNAGACQRCHHKCRSCETSPIRCTSCFNTSLYSQLLNNTCIPSCADGTYFDNENCFPCSYKCKKCLSANLCLSCQTSYYISRQSLNVTCLPCSQSCLQCAGSSNSCIYCRSPLSLISLLSICSPSCPLSQIKILINQEFGYICKPCDPSCVTCLPTPIDCTQCKNGYYLNTSLGTSSCFPCQKGCQSCLIISQCSGTCISGYFKNFSNNRCIKCDVSCLTCKGSLPTDCLSCSLNIPLQSGRCIGCAPICLTCTSPLSCTSCADPYFYYSLNNSCLLTCPLSTYKYNRICLNCSQNCVECLNNTSCTRCNLNYPYVDEGKCVKLCPREKFILGALCKQCNGTVYGQGKLCCFFPLKLINSECTYQKNDTTPLNVSNESQIVYQLVKLYKNSLYVTINSPKLNVTKIPKTLELQLLKKIYDSHLKPQLIVLNLPLIYHSETSNSITFASLAPEIRPQGYLASILLNQTLGSLQRRYSSSLLTQSYYSFIQSSPIRFLKILSIPLCIILFVFGLFSKFKGHYIAQQSNLLVIHSLNFCQASALFKNVFVLPKQLYSFLEGLMVSHLSFFWNMFNTLIPKQYLQPNYPGSLTPDGNFLRQAGFSITFLILITAIFIICVIVSYALFCFSNYQQPPFIRKILRLYFFLASLCFMNITFCAVTSSRYHHASSSFIFNASLYSKSYGAGIFFLVIIPILILTFLLHYYLTYVQQFDEYIYTLRQGAQLFCVYFQGIILGLSVSKYTTLFLILVEILWFTFNLVIDLHRNGGFKTRLSVISGLIGLSYLLLSFGDKINIGVVVILTLIIITLIVYCSYHVVGLYYYCLCGNPEQDEAEEDIQGKY